MLKSFIGADMRLYERFGIGLHNNPDAQEHLVRNAHKYWAFWVKELKFTTNLPPMKEII